MAQSIMPMSGRIMVTAPTAMFDPAAHPVAATSRSAASGVISDSASDNASVESSSSSSSPDAAAPASAAADTSDISDVSNSSAVAVASSSVTGGEAVAVALAGPVLMSKGAVDLGVKAAIVSVAGSCFIFFRLPRSEKCEKGKVGVDFWMCDISFLFCKGISQRTRFTFSMEKHNWKWVNGILSCVLQRTFCLVVIVIIYFPSPPSPSISFDSQ